MNENQTWLAQLIESDRGSLGLARCQSGFVREQREQLRLLWDDDCGRDLAIRYLNPIEEYWDICGSRIESQAECLSSARTHLGRCEACADRAIARAQEFGLVLKECRAVELQIESLRTVVARRLNEVSESTVEVAELLEQAEQAAATG